MKSKEFGRPGGGACVPHAPPRSANGYGHDRWRIQVFSELFMVIYFKKEKEIIKLGDGQFGFATVQVVLR